MVIVWIPVALTLLALLIATAVAWWRGETADKIVTTGFLIDETASLFALDWNNWLQVQSATLVIDVVLLAIIGAVTLRWAAAHRILLSSLQLLVVGVHASRGMLISEHDGGGAYSLALCVLTYFETFILLTAMLSLCWGGRAKLSPPRNLH